MYAAANVGVVAIPSKWHRSCFAWRDDSAGFRLREGRRSFHEREAAPAGGRTKEIKNESQHDSRDITRCSDCFCVGRPLHRQGRRTGKRWCRPRRSSNQQLDPIAREVPVRDVRVQRGMPRRELRLQGVRLQEMRLPTLTHAENHRQQTISACGLTVQELPYQRGPFSQQGQNIVEAQHAHKPTFTIDDGQPAAGMAGHLPQGDIDRLYPPNTISSKPSGLENVVSTISGAD